MVSLFSLNWNKGSKISKFMGVLIGRCGDRKARTVKTLQVASERLVPGLGVGRGCQSKAGTQIWQRDTKQVSSLDIMLTTEIKVQPPRHTVEWCPRRCLRL